MANVKVYSTNSCPWCHKAKEYLRAKKIAFDDINVSENQQALAEMIDKSGQRGVPVLDVKGKIIVGFDKEEIDEALGK